MKVKKIVCAILSGVFCYSNFCNTGASALFGNAHFNLGEMVIEKSNVNLSESEKNAFLSGMVYADIGRFEFDKETGLDSDTVEFANKMKALAENDEEKWFAYGFSMHAFQDKKTQKLLKDILGHDYSSYIDYMTGCGIIDSYFSKKSGGLCNEFLDKFDFEQVTNGWNIEQLDKLLGIPKDKVKIFVGSILNKYQNGDSKKNNLVLYDELIKKAYKSLEFEISLDEIHKQAGNIIGAFAVMSSVIEMKREIPKELTLKIEEKCKDLADECISEFEFMKV